MTDNNSDADFNREGQPAFGGEEENDNSADSSSEENDTEDTHSADGDENSQDDPDKDKPFHEHPRWKEREEEHKKRFNDMEARHQEDMKKLREEFSGKGREEKPAEESTKVPGWFGGSQEQWDEYQRDLDARFENRSQSERQKEEDRVKNEAKAVEDATTYLKSEITFLETDASINPDKIKVDPAKLLKIAMETDGGLITPDGKWNYRAAFRIMRQTAKPAAADTTVTKERKNLAAASTSESKGEQKPANFKTSADFKKNRPW